MKRVENMLIMSSHTYKELSLELLSSPSLPLYPSQSHVQLWNYRLRCQNFGGTLINLLIINYFLKINGLALVSCFPKIKASRCVESNITSPSRIMPVHTHYTQKPFQTLQTAAAPRGICDM